VRGHIAKIPVVLASATPSVETEVNARKGRYQRVVLPSRFGGQHMPHIEAIDLRREAPVRGRFISPKLAEHIQIAIERREQALLFLNRRGYAPLTLCRACGHRFACTICDAWLVDHRFRQRLVCHHCGFSMPRPQTCPHCQAEESLVAVGPGVERLQEEAASLFPNARTMVLSSDLITSIETMRSELNEIAEGRVDIIVGTQLVAKGHNFPRLNLVGVVDADLGLSNGDPRAAERTFQLLNQVIGRAGRDQGRGVGYLQTHQPEHPVMKALVACDREAFYASEIEARERAGYPPFGRLAALIVSAGDRPTAEGFARKLAAIAPIDERIKVLGPAEAPLAVIKGRYRFRLLVKSLRNVDLSEYLREWLATAPKTKGNLKLEVDVDPQSFLERPSSSLRGASATKQSSFLCRKMDCFAGVRNDGPAKAKKPAVIGDGRLYRYAANACGGYATQRLPNMKDGRGAQTPERGYMTSATTRPTPAPVIPISRAAAVDRSSTRPWTNGPRSLTVTTTLRLPWVTRSLVPNGSERWAQVRAFWLKRWPEAVRLPDSLP
jgi:primosomal protein N' (replication factor Y) (superfamily II helicase)